MFEKVAKLRVVAQSDMVLLHPNESPKDNGLYEELEASPPSSSTVAEGQVILSLPTARKVKKLQVELIGKQNILIKSQYETYEVFRRVVELDIGATTLGPGDHTYAFSFVIPSDTAPYERCDYGRTYYHIVATATGLGKFGTDLTADENIEMICNLSETAGVPPGFSMEQETSHDALGPIGVTLFSKYLLVAGFLRLNVTLPSFSQAVRIDDIKVELIQTFKLQSLKRPGKSDVRTVTVPIWRIEGRESLGSFQAGDEFSCLRQFRLPDDEKIRPTTSQYSKTGIHVSHRLAVLIHFTPLQNNPRQDTQEIKFATDATFSSCCCIWVALQLPAYSKEPTALDLDPSFIGYCTMCLCKIPPGLAASYGVSEEELKAARMRASQPDPSPIKTDEEFGRDILARQSPTPLAIPSEATVP